MARLVVLTPNPAVDVTYEVTRQVIGETVRVHRVRRRAGGKGVNVVRVLQVLGHDAVAVQPLGGDAGRWLREQLETDGVCTRAVDVAEETRTTVTVVDGVSHPTLYAEAGPALAPEVWSRLAAVVEDECEPGGTLVVSGSLPPGTDPAQVRVLVDAAHRASARALVDTSGPALLAAADGGAVSANVAPPTRTRSVLRNRLLAAAYRGAGRFGVEVFEPATSSTLMAALLVHDLRTAPTPTPADLLPTGAAHGGLWRTGYSPRSALGLAVLAGLRVR